jgi:polysaccharide biosynthesis protein PelF
MERVDVCLLLEGTYPFVRGGVASWVHQIVSGLPELRFAVIFIGGRRPEAETPRYTLPGNVVSVRTAYLEEALHADQGARGEPSREALGAVDAYHGSFGDPARHGPAADALLTRAGSAEGPSLAHFMHSEAAWQRITRAYTERDPTAPFIDYFWTLRMLHAPLFTLARLAAEAPEARVYHTVSTGYAGMLAAMLAARRKRPVLLSEHGIYTKERQIDLNAAEWLDPRGLDGTASRVLTSDTFRSLWIAYFEELGRLTYRASACVVSLYEGNRQRQLRDGASAERARVIVNGVRTARFAKARAARGERPPCTVGFVGRLVPIKDLKTFVRALAVVFDALPAARGLVIGGADEDPRYAEECHSLAAALGILPRIDFLGHRDVTEVFPELGVLMLSSISEAQPLAVLEAFASGVPCVTTDVGACREQIEGGSPEDRALGHAGRVVGFGDPDALGHAVVDLLRDHQEYQRCQAAALARVTTLYEEAQMLASYRDLYHSLGEG